MSWFSELLHGGKNPADAANDYLNQIPGATQPYYQPYIDQGQNADEDLIKRYNDLLNNPGGIYSELGKGYKESPGYQFKLQQALQAGTNAAAAGGMDGSLAHQQGNMQLANDIASQDFDNYIKQIMGLYTQGLSGEQGTSERGFNASTGYGDIIGQTLGQQGQYGFAGQSAKNANQSNLFGNVIKGIGTVGGYALGGPGGAALNLLPNRSYG